MKLKEKISRKLEMVLQRATRQTLEYFEMTPEDLKKQPELRKLLKENTK